MPHVYISHSGADPDALLQLHEALRAAGIADRYLSGEGERATSDGEISSAFAVIVLVSAAAVRSRTVRQDV